ncbi:hypothetical protein [Streptomyces fulvorobeus]|uniref:Lipoprotein CseA n=1 Tax=Streptomyces fulvorobeus TaxID=284028 RepID=A0A7J0C5R5_9ACTN|nr:hypothetical protein [Streptomyces fulvorobeus]NYE41480.1 hypothetical protein [Streptomyces fulvorobeus]GFM97842.1 lipoprotein CseA [Streptomyces fulvorobeus]
MRGLTGGSEGTDGGPGTAGTAPGGCGVRAALAASGTAMAGLAAFALLGASCSAGGTGTRDEGPAGTKPVTQVTPSLAAPTTTAQPARRVNAVALLKRDPGVSPRVRTDLRPCSGDEYPVDTSYGSLTDGPAADVVVNVLTCGDSVGIGTYVYRPRDDGSYENVFAAEMPAVYGTIDRGDLVVTTQVYGSRDSVAYPSGEEVITYRWTDGRFSEHDRVLNDFNRAVSSGEGALPPQAEPTRS